MVKMDAEVLVDSDVYPGGHFGWGLLIFHRSIAFLLFRYKCQHIGARKNRKGNGELFQIHIFL